MKHWAWAALGAALLANGAHAAPIYGDVDGDGHVTLKDAVILSRVANHLMPLTDTIRHMGDVAPVNDYDNGSFGDGVIDAKDVALVMKYAAGAITGDFPAKVNYYLLEVGNSYTLQKLDSSGTVTGTITNTIVSVGDETVGGTVYHSYVANGTDGGVEHLTDAKKDSGGNYVPFTDSQGRRAIGLISGMVGTASTSFTPPLVVLVYPVDPSTTWTESTKSPLSTPYGNITATVSYTGAIAGPQSVTVPVGTFANTYEVTLPYTAKYSVLTVASGTEQYWFVPGLGPIQHAQASGSGTPYVDLKLISANIHGVLYP